VRSRDEDDALDRAAGHGRLVAGLAGAAALARLVWIVAVPTHPVGDFAMYWESAGDFVERGAFDEQFIYMPGYVLALAAVRALGGGIFAAKLLGVGAGALATAAVTGLAARLFGRAAAVVAGLLCALWPAGVAVSSVLGTDMPARRARHRRRVAARAGRRGPPHARRRSLRGLHGPHGVRAGHRASARDPRRARVAGARRPAGRRRWGVRPRRWASPS